jgi:hypothetical protein
VGGGTQEGGVPREAAAELVVYQRELVESMRREVPEVRRKILCLAEALAVPTSKERAASWNAYRAEQLRSRHALALQRACWRLVELQFFISSFDEKASELRSRSSSTKAAVSPVPSRVVVSGPTIGPTAAAAMWIYINKQSSDQEAATPPVSKTSSSSPCAESLEFSSLLTPVSPDYPPPPPSGRPAVAACSVVLRTESKKRPRSMSCAG